MMSCLATAAARGGIRRDMMKAAEWRRNRIAWRLVLALLVGLPLPGCASIFRLDPPPAEIAQDLPVLGIPNARFWPEGPPDALIKEGRMITQREAASAPRDALGRLLPARFLALSAGSDSGAFGAGLLVGWTAAGDRPSFNVVTGVSAGALIAPFAFLGPAYDAQLREVFTTLRPSDVALLRRRVMALLFGEALADTSPLSRLIQRYANAAMLKAIAAEYARGRLLLIGTTNLDLQRPVIWNIGAIAASGHPQALELFRRILLASASIPGAFPPVLIDVEQDGHAYQEMHVDGAVASHVFLYPPSLNFLDTVRATNPERERIAYVIRNGRMDVESASTSRGLFSIASRSIATLVHFSGVNDVSRIYLTTLRDGVGFRLAFIGADFVADRPEPFDPAFMRALFEYGYELARNGYPWRTAPPDIGTLPANAAGSGQRRRE
jgi:hypothetical protein